MKLWAKLLLLSAWCLGCARVPAGLKPIEGFEPQRYLGTWYEIARLDHSFERGLDQISATYSMNPDGTIKVVNRGFNVEKGKWQEAIGRAKFAADQATGHLRVSFFGPFYGDYVILELDKDNYSYVMLCGPSRDYFWILARRPSLSPETLRALINQAREFGFDTSKLIYPQHSISAQSPRR